tara:strand:- start:10498 stop:10677 length:180 start_codon:yes stop_codon:yes gene_type:complete
VASPEGNPEGAENVTGTLGSKHNPYKSDCFDIIYLFFRFTTYRHDLKAVYGYSKTIDSK